MEPMKGIKATSSIQINLSRPKSFRLRISIIAIAGSIMATIFVSSQISNIIESIIVVFNSKFFCN